MAGGPLDTLRQFMAELGTDDSFLEELVSLLERERNALPGDLFQAGELDLRGFPVSEGAFAPGRRADFFPGLGQRRWTS
ncbi:MAG: hypothetical protein RQM92_12580 [Candidatus Syntrophopropionicum ammoniitolerans]